MAINLSDLDPDLRALADEYGLEALEFAKALGERALGFGEAAGTVGTGLLGAIPAGLSGLGTAMTTGDLGKSADAIRNVQEGLTYVPRMDAGKEYLRGLAGGIEKVENTINKAPAAFLSGGLSLEQQRSAAGREAVQSAPSLSDLTLKYAGPEAAAAGYTALNFMDPTHLKYLAAIAPLGAIGRSKPVIGEYLFSALEDTVEKAGQRVATGDQWLGFLQNKGVKKAELEDRGTRQFLESRVGQPVTKEELTKHLEDTRFQLSPRVLGGDYNPDFKLLADENQIDWLETADYPGSVPSEAYIQTLRDPTTGQRYQSSYHPDHGLVVHSLEDSGNPDIPPVPTRQIFEMTLDEANSEFSSERIEDAIRRDRPNVPQEQWPVNRLASAGLVPEFGARYGDPSYRMRDIPGTNYREIAYQLNERPRLLGEYTSLDPDGGSINILPAQMEARLLELEQKSRHPQLKWYKVKDDAESDALLNREEMLDSLLREVERQRNLGNTEDAEAVRVELARQMAEFDRDTKPYQYEKGSEEPALLSRDEQMELRRLKYEKQFGGPPVAGGLPEYLGGHWGDRGGHSRSLPDITSHTRIIDRDYEGDPYLHMEELQSDPHQAAYEAWKGQVHELMKSEDIPYEEAAARVDPEIGYQKPSGWRERERYNLRRDEELLTQEYLNLTGGELAKRAESLGLDPRAMTGEIPIPANLTREQIARILSPTGDSERFLRSSRAYLIEDLRNSKNPLETLNGEFPRYRAEEIFNQLTGVKPLGVREIMERDPRYRDLEIRRGQAQVGVAEVPDMPMKWNWHEPILQHLLMQAVREGKEGFLWTSGLDQISRWSDALREQVDEIRHERLPDNTLRVIALKNGRPMFSGEMAPGKTVFTTASESKAEGKSLNAVFGSSIAKQIEEGSPRLKPEEIKAPKDTLGEPDYVGIRFDFDGSYFGVYGKKADGTEDFLGYQHEEFDYSDPLEAIRDPRYSPDDSELNRPTTPGLLGNKKSLNDILTPDQARSLQNQTNNWEGPGSVKADLDGPIRIRTRGKKKIKEKHVEATPNYKSITGDDLTVGGAGMTTFYDQKIPQYIRSIAKKYGAPVDKVRVGANQEEILNDIAGLTEYMAGQETRLNQLKAERDAIDWDLHDKAFEQARDGLDKAKEKLEHVRDGLHDIYYDVLRDPTTSAAIREDMGDMGVHYWVRHQDEYIDAQKQVQEWRERGEALGQSKQDYDIDIEDLEWGIQRDQKRMAELLKKTQGKELWRLKFNDKMKEGLKEKRKLYKRGGMVRKSNFADGGLVESSLLPTSTDQWLDALDEPARQMLAGFQRLPYRVMGTPVDLATMALRPMGYDVPAPTGGSDWMIEQAQKYGLLPPSANTGAEALGDIVGSMVDPATGAAKAGTALKAALPILGIRPLTEVARGARSPAFVSRLEQGILKLPERMPASQALGTLRNMPGISPEELGDTRVQQWLEQFGDQPISRTDLHEAFREAPPLQRRVDPARRAFHGVEADEDAPGFSPKTRAQRAVLYSYPEHPDEYVSPHFNPRDNPGYENVFMNALVGDRVTPAGKRYLHVEESQSDLHQAARKYGYADAPKGRSYSELLARFEELSKNTDQHGRELNQAFKDIGKEYSIKVPSGLGQVFWTTDPDGIPTYTNIPEAQAKLEAALNRYAEQEGEVWKISDQLERMGDDMALTGQIGPPPRYPMEKSWDSLVLKDLAHMAARYGYDGLSINQSPALIARYPGVPPGGMVRHYDQRAPKILDKLGKKYGVRVEPEESWGDPAWKIDFNDQMKQGLLEEPQGLYRRGGRIP